MTKSIRIISIVFLFLFSSIPLVFAADPSQDFFYTQMQEGLSAPQIHAAQENVDPFSGNLKLVHTDFQLPGNGGLDLKIMRTYNSGIWGRRDVSFPGLIAYNERSPLGIGWSMHMGIVKNPFGTGSANQYLTNNPVVEMPDGSQHALYVMPGQQNTFISKEYWIYKYINTNGTWELTLTDGTVYTFRYNPSGPGYTTYDGVQVAQATGIRNAAGTASITINYTRNGTYSYLTSVVDSLNRTITFNYDYTNRRLNSIQLGSTTLMSYSYQVISTNNYLTTAQPPVGSPWRYAYYTSANSFQLQTLTYPAGGNITYTYTNVPFDTGVVRNVQFNVVTRKVAGGRGIPAGTWNYTYNSVASPATTTISAPNGITETHTFHSWASSCPARQGSCGNVWRIGLPISKQISAGLTESYAWTAGPSISNDRISNSNWTETGGFIYDSAIYVPRMTSKTITRDGRAYATTYSNYDAYSNAGTIAETGDVNRTTTITHWYNTARNIVANKPDVVTVTGSFSGSFATNYDYDANSGNITQITKHGVPTYFTYDGVGNLEYIRDANNHTTYFDWSNGRISRKQNPVYTVNRSINTNGTIASETNGRGYATTYSYDGNLRLTLINPPSIENDTTISYAAANSSKTQTKGGYSVTTNYDGFGRQTGTADSKGVTSSTAYAAYGFKTSSTSNVGDTINYDFFGRTDNIVHKDNEVIDYAYSNSNVTVTDESGRNTLLTYNAFGNPDEKLLMSVRDAANSTTSYTYNILGSLLTINQAGIGQRTFTYDTRNYLAAEQHPDRGTITYGRDSVGNMTGKTDGLDASTYVYDNINRLTRISNDSGTITFGYDNADNRTSMNNPAANISFEYDTVNRMTRKTEAILSQSYVTEYDYDANDNLIGIDYPLGRHVTYGYNGNNQVTSVTGFGGTISSIGYYTSGTAIGLPSQYTFSNGHTTTLTYNSRNLTTGISAGPSASALHIGYGYDDRGNTTAITNYLYPAENRTLGYDDLNRLNTINGTWGGYTYDAWGNRQSKRFGSNTTSYTYTSNRLTSAVSGGITTPYNYNVDGDLRSVGNYDLNYDSNHNLLTYVTGTTTLAGFTYDGGGMRVTKTSNGKTIVYHYDQSGKVLSETDQNKHLWADYVYLHGKLIAKIEPLPPAAPTALDVWPAYANQINLSWTDNADNELGYTIERMVSGGSFSVIGTVGPNVTTFSDTGLTPGTTYIYQVRGYNQVGTSAYSNSGSSVPVSNPLPAISATPATWNFGAVVVGSTPTTKTFAISNTGTNDLLIGTLFITGINAGSFTIPSNTDNCTGRTLVPHNTNPTTCTFIVTFAPLVGGLNNANVTIPSNDPNTPQTNLTLQGMGQYTLAVQKIGTGAGSVASLPAGITCGATCSSTYDGGTSITLTASPDSDSSFNGWAGGGCTSANPCTFALSSHTTVTATFNILPPIANFSASPTTVGTIPFAPVTFTDTSTRAHSWLWNFGDGTTSTLQNPVHTYTTVGTYTVSLLVSNPTGTNTSTMTNYITVQPCPDQPVRINRGNGALLIPFQTLQAAYNAAIGQDVIEALAVNFIENINFNRPITVTINGGFACGYSQQIGNSTIQGQVTASDGTITMGTFEIVGNTPGSIYDIVAVAGLGGSISPAGTVTVAQGGNQIFTITPSQNYYIQDVFVDGLSVGSAATYTFTNVTTNHRIEASFTTTAPILPSADFSGTPTIGVAPITVNFTDLSTQAPSQWLWNFGDGTTSTLKDPTHTYNTVGNYTVTLTATNSVGPGTVTKTNYIAVLAVPPAVRIAGATPVYYPTIQAAYAAAANGAVIQVRDASLIENLVANRDITITLEGGYNADYSTGTGVTPLQGSIVTSAGAITISNFNLLQ